MKEKNMLNLGYWTKSFGYNYLLDQLENMWTNRLITLNYVGDHWR